MTTITLRSVVPADLPIFFEQMRDPEAVRMAAFASENPNDRAAFDAHWAIILAASDVVIRAIDFEDQVAGSIISYPDEERREVAYWLGRTFWGRGIATAALAAFLQEETARPIYARVAIDNIGSRRILEKNGFVVIGQERGLAHGRGEVIDEIVLVLNGEAG